ncbi:MAG: V-type ATP synthase subunit E [Synergistaceae bacterium]|jgi:V/A-type H+-transporting ATPase subunit E|nr:V-type ATP synthase subunit E [Synergistaceae bacterium]
MSLAQITKKIEQDAREEADAILQRSREQEAAIQKDVEVEVARLEASASGRFEVERPEIFKRREIVAKLDVGKIRLAAERRLISDVFELGLERLKKLDKAEYVNFCERLLKKSVESGDEAIELSSGEKYLDSSWVSDFNKSNGTRISVSDRKGDFSGGFVLRKGRTAINCSWEMLIQVASENLENEVVSRLFSD